MNKIFARIDCEFQYGFFDSEANYLYCEEVHTADAF